MRCAFTSTMLALSLSLSAGAAALAQDAAPTSPSPAPALTASVQATAPLTLLQAVPIDLTGYLEAKTLPQSFSDPAQVVAALESSRNIALHMEVLRRAAHQLPLESRRALVESVNKRHKELPDDAFRYFDAGYAQVLIDGNKTGLFFLRKANDQLKNQFTSLAYAMAQAEVERNQEAGDPTNFTPRKQDVTFKLTDAVNRDAEAHLPGFWPAFLGVLERLRPMEAYADYARTDFTQQYLPYGVMPTITHPGESSSPEDEDGASPEDVGVVGEASNLEASCSYPELSAPLDFSKLFRSVTLPLDGQGQLMTAHFFRTDVDHQYRAVVQDAQQHTLADFMTFVAPYVFEDLDGDGAPEIVVRQMAQDPAHPLQVYRYKHCAFQPDETVSALFR